MSPWLSALHTCVIRQDTTVTACTCTTCSAADGHEFWGNQIFCPDSTRPSPFLGDDCLCCRYASDWLDTSDRMVPGSLCIEVCRHKQHSISHSSLSAQRQARHLGCMAMVSKSRVCDSLNDRTGMHRAFKLQKKVSGVYRANSKHKHTSLRPDTAAIVH